LSSTPRDLYSGVARAAACPSVGHASYMSSPARPTHLRNTPTS
jgi:hypothetical protein